VNIRDIAPILVVFITASGCGTTASEGQGEGSAESDASAANRAETAQEAIPERNYTEARTPCAHYTATRQPFYGDLHVHTGFSFDARNYDNRLTPAEAYAFAKGERVDLAPYDDAGVATRSAKLDRPLDFVGVTDHGEFLGEIYECVTPGSDAYESETCVDYRDPESNGAFAFGMLLALDSPDRFEDICDDDGLGCQDSARIRWQAMQQAAEDAYDRTETCAFTSFVAYEYTNTYNVSNLHRNVIFRNAVVPDLPVTYFEAPTPVELWQRLDSQCRQADDSCDVLVLPHNSNLSNGQLFHISYPKDATLEEQKALAELRASMEPVVEMFQHKGDSECRNGFEGVNAEHDPFCEFEKLRRYGFDDCGDSLGTGGMRLWGCLHRLDFVREVLKEGLLEGVRIGINPYKLGMIGSTDTHNGTPGMVEEQNFPGHVGNVDDTARKRLGSGNVTHDGIINNPGGLAAVWAEENSRDAIFDAIMRKETFATSGPRIAVRFFGGWNFDEGVCGDHEDMLKRGYEDGVSMGATLTERPEEGANGPGFIVQAGWDPGTDTQPGVPLERFQVIKGWVDDDGASYEKVYDVVLANADPAPSVDLESCEAQGEGITSHCVLWSDPDFDPEQSAFYYARIIENPTCRWSTRKCGAMPAADRPESCADEAIPSTVQERAWSSPIWYTPNSE
jgi:hypothetical protein